MQYMIHVCIKPCCFKKIENTEDNETVFYCCRPLWVVLICLVVLGTAAGFAIVSTLELLLAENPQS